MPETVLVTDAIAKLLASVHCGDWSNVCDAFHTAMSDLRRTGTTPDRAEAVVLRQLVDAAFRAAPAPKREDAGVVFPRTPTVSMTVACLQVLRSNNVFKGRGFPAEIWSVMWDAVVDEASMSEKAEKRDA